MIWPFSTALRAEPARLRRPHTSGPVPFVAAYRIILIAPSTEVRAMWHCGIILFLSAPRYFCDADYLAYRDLLARRLPMAQVELLAYCLMPDHVHLIVIPHRPDSLSRLLRKAHALYARLINLEHGWQSYLWQARFHSFLMDEEHLLAAARYVELNSVRAGLCEHPDDWLLLGEVRLALKVTVALGPQAVAEAYPGRLIPRPSPDLPAGATPIDFA